MVTRFATAYANIDRQSYEITAKTTDAQKTSTKKAILNKDFRQAIMFAFNRKAYVAQANREAANKVIRNTFTPPNFVQINGQQFGDAVEKDWLMGMRMERGLCHRWKDTLTINQGQESLPKLRQICRLKEFNSQFIWTANFFNL